MTINGVTVSQGESVPGIGASASERMTSGQRFRLGFQKIVRAREATLAGVVVLLVVYLSFASPYFLTAGNLTVVGRQIALALIISVGMTFVILIGGIDLSVGSTVALVSVLTGEFMVTIGIPPVLAVFFALVGGGIVGLVNGIINAYVGIPSFVVTLGMLAVARGLSLGITSGSTISGFPPEFLNLGRVRPSAFPFPCGSQW